MPYQLQMRFAGLCAFVPEKAPGVDDNQVHVLLVNPNGSDAKRLLSRTLRKHSPLLRFPLKNLAGVNGAAGDLEELVGTRELDSLDVTLHLRTRGTKKDEPLAGGVQIYSDTGAQAIKPLEHTVQERDFTWLPCMDEVLPGAEVDQAFLGDFSEAGPRDSLKARVKLDGGTLRTDAISMHQEDFVVFQFIPSPIEGTFVRQAMAHWAALDVDVDDDIDVVIRTRPFGSESKPEELVLRPNGEKSVVVDISNLCCGHYIEDDEEEVTEVSAPEAEVDFEAYFLLCADP
ncbi:MAG TPA: hypothetical protein VE078_19305, partial [Thermoanaerobaculia bacterium]|nr:hypothetical protein [Thermoanaerobaculia bacterium]